MSRKRHVYFVSYLGQNGSGMTYGNVEMFTTLPITGMDDIHGITAEIEAANPGTRAVAVLSYQLMRTEKGDVTPTATEETQR